MPALEVMVVTAKKSKFFWEIFTVRRQLISKRLSPFVNGIPYLTPLVPLSFKGEAKEGLSPSLAIGIPKREGIITHPQNRLDFDSGASPPIK